MKKLGYKSIIMASFIGLSLVLVSCGEGTPPPPTMASSTATNTTTAEPAKVDPSATDAAPASDPAPAGGKTCKVGTIEVPC